MSIEKLPAMIDQLYELRELRLQHQRQTDKLKKQETELQQEIIMAMAESGMTSAGGAHAKATYKVVDKPVAANWDEVYHYIAENDAFDLLQRRLGEGAVKARWEDGITIPGVTAFPVDKLTLSKVS